MTRITHVLTVATLTAATAFGQGSDHRYQLFAGYSFQDAEFRDAHGWNASLSVGLKRRLDLVADVSGHYLDIFRSRIPPSLDRDMYHFLFGPQVSLGEFNRFKPFARIMAGVMRFNGDARTNGQIRLSESTDFALSVGGGVDIKVSERISFRVLQFDLIRDFERGNHDRRYRFSSGLVIGF